MSTGNTTTTTTTIAGNACTRAARAGLAIAAAALLALAACGLAPGAAHARGLAAGELSAEVHEQADTATRVTAMHRLYNPNSGEHFYTASTSEKDFLAKIGWKYEGVGWYAPNSGGNVYRLYNPNSGDHHYTTSASEKDYLARIGWRYEGVGWHSGGNVALYRQYNPNAWVGTHNYTTSKSEHDFLVGIGWRGEGVAWKGVDHAHAWQPVTKNVTTTEKYEAMGTGPLEATNYAKFRELYSGQSNYREYYYTDDNGVRRQGEPYMVFSTSLEAAEFMGEVWRQHGIQLHAGSVIETRNVTKAVTTGYTCSGCGVSK